MVGAWRAFDSSGTREGVVNYARGLETGNRFDLVVEPDHAALRIARDDAELFDGVRHPGSPRPVIVLDLADDRAVVGTFNRIANRTKPPSERSPGRPRSADRGNVSALRGEGSSMQPF